MVLFKDFGLDDSSFPNNKFGDSKVVMAFGKHVGLDFVSHGMVNNKG